jgi:hypothetical protein
VGATRTAWHVILFALLVQRAPRRFEVRREVSLSAEPLRADFLLLLRTLAGDEPAGTLKRLWSLLPRAAIVEFKSVGRPYRARNLDRLWAYLHLYYVDQRELLGEQADLCGVLLVAARTPSLDADAKALGLDWKDLGDGYWELTLGPFALYVVEIDVAADTERDELLRLLGHATIHTAPARRWLSEQLGGEEIAMHIGELEGYDDLIKKLVEGLPPEHVLAVYEPEQRLAGLPPEQRLAGLPPEQRLAGLSAEQVLLAMPDEALRALSQEYVATLSEPTREAIRARIGRH